MKRVELASKLSLITDFDEKEEMREKIEELDRQIKILESMALNR